MGENRLEGPAVQGETLEEDLVDGGRDQQLNNTMYEEGSAFIVHGIFL